MNKEMGLISLLIASNIVFADDIKDLLKSQGIGAQEETQPATEERPKKICERGRTYRRTRFLDPDTGEVAVDAKDAPITITSLNPSEIQELFDKQINKYSKADLGLYGTKTENNACSERAQIVGCRLLKECGIRTGKIFVNFLDGMVPVDLGENGKALWKGHVANTIYQEDANGKPKLMIIDRLVNIALKKSGPIPYEEWISFLTSKGKYKIDKKLTYPGQFQQGDKYNLDSKYCEIANTDYMMQLIRQTGAKQSRDEAIGGAR